MKTVCIVGAGPAGIVTAKKLLQTGQFSVTVLEKADRIGGIWALSKCCSTNGFLSPLTPTNLSKFTVGFSDLAWDSVELDDLPLNGSWPAAKRSASHVAPIFPRAWQVNRYLETFRRRYIPDGTIKLQTEVVAANRVAPSTEKSKHRWEVTSKNSTGEQSTAAFDHLIIAAGFFSRPRPIQQDVPGLGAGSLAVNVIHSSQFRSLDDLFPPDREVNGKSILIIGGGNSSGEAAAAVAQQLSASQYGLDAASRRRFKGCRILHVIPRPLYALPPFLPVDEHHTTFVPLDFSFYNLAKRMPGTIVAGGGITSKEFKELLHSGLQASIGGDQSDLGPAALVQPEGSERGSVQVALAESYAEFVRSGLIDVYPGRVTGLHPEQDHTVSAQLVSKDSSSRRLDNIGAVLHATGYSPIPALEILDESTRKALHYDPNSMRLPVILEQWQTMGSAVPDIAFHGFYEGPYWPIMEMQARLTAERWLNDLKPDQRTFEVEEKMLELRQAMFDRQLDVPQYWFGDYAGYMEEMATALKLQRNDGPFAEREGAVSPGRYLWKGDNEHEANKIMEDLYRVWQAATIDGKFVARAAFRALQGNWEIKRNIDSRNGVFPSGVLTGTASFSPRSPTEDKSGQEFDFEYLYIEAGTFATSTGMQMNASRRYVYRYSETLDELSIWFVKPDSEYEVDYLFHTLAFASPEEVNKAGACVAKADHLCVKDMYWTEYVLPIKGIALPSFSIKHTVKGPEKDYVSQTEYTRPPKQLR